MLWVGHDAFDWNECVAYKLQMEELEGAADMICVWLVKHGIGVDQVAVSVEEANEYSELKYIIEFGCRIPNDYKERFLELEVAFWKCVEPYCPLHIRLIADIYSENFESGSTIWEGPDDFLVMIEPDQLSVRYQFPPNEFWEKRLEIAKRVRTAEVSREQERWRVRRSMSIVASNELDSRRVGGSVQAPGAHLKVVSSDGSEASDAGN